MLPMLLLGGLIVGSALRIVASFPGPDPAIERQRLAKRKQDEDTEVARQRRILDTFKAIDGNQRIYVAESQGVPTIRRYTPAFEPPPWDINVAMDGDVEYFQFQTHRMLSGQFELTVRPCPRRSTDLSADFAELEHHSLGGDGYYENRMRFLHEKVRTSTGNSVQWFIVRVSGPGRDWLFEHQSMNRPPRYLPAPDNAEFRAQDARAEQEKEAKRRAASMDGLGEQLSEAVAKRDNIIAKIAGYSCDEDGKETMREMAESTFDKELERIRKNITQAYEDAYFS